MRVWRATVHYAAEPGYEVTMLKDATASYSDKEMHAALFSINRSTPGRPGAEESNRVE
jgi:nicotinamidase-related amidase